MGGKFINTSQKMTINSLVDGYKSRLNNPYYIYTDKKPTITTYYNINKQKTTLDEALKVEYSRLGKDSPLRFNQINNFFLYGIERITVDLDIGEYGIESNPIEGEAIILPNTIEPSPNDYFVINYTKNPLLFKVTGVTCDTIENDNNFWKITYKLDRPSDEYIKDQIVEEYEMIIDNVGTQFKSIIRKNDYDYIYKLDNILVRIKEYYDDLFYNRRVQTYTYEYKNKNFYDPYMIEFLIRNNVLQKDKNDFVYIRHQTEIPKTFAIDYDKTIYRFFENPDLDNKHYSPRYLGQAEYIDEIMSIFDCRSEDYFKIYYISKQVNINEYVIECFDTDLITNIFNNERFDGDDYRNIIIGYFYNEKIDGNTLELLESIEFTDNKELFYNIPILIYAIENNIKELLKTYK